MDRAQIIDENFRRRIAARDLPEGAAPTPPLETALAQVIFKAAVESRGLDRISRRMQAQGKGFYTIGSSGHEGMAAVAAALRTDDMAFLHYRDGAFLLARAATAKNQVPQATILRDMLLSFACAAADPVSGGRHKVLGSRALFVPPQTSTIASHLPKAVGAAWSIGATRRQPSPEAILPADAIIFCSFGDASLNHSTAQGAINAAGWTAYQSTPLPILFCCEDNGIGISTKSPEGWVEANLRAKPGVAYFAANGLDIFETYRVASEAAHYVRTRSKPAILHLKTVRLFGHAGADVPGTYLSKTEIERDEANDPLLHMVRGLEQARILTPDEALAVYDTRFTAIEALAAEVAHEAHLKTAQDVMASIIPPPRLPRPTNGPSELERAALFGTDMAMMAKPQPMARLISWALHDLMLAHPETLIMGQDVGRKGGVYGVTQKLQQRFGSARVIDTLLDEQSILGLAIGASHNGYLPMPEIQFLAYLHNAEDQLRGEAATLPFFSRGTFTNPMVVRIAGLGYQKGFGGHFHNDNSLAVLRDIPGLILAAPSDGAEAVRMLRECHRLAREENRVVVFLEPIALYHSRDLSRTGDERWMRRYPAVSERLRFGEIGISGDASADITLLSFANGIHLAHQARHELAAQGVSARILDLRWLAPLPRAALERAIHRDQRVLIIDETRISGGVAESLMAHLAERGVTQLARVCAEDSFIATGPAYAATLPDVSTVVNVARRLCATAATA